MADRVSLFETMRMIELYIFQPQVLLPGNHITCGTGMILGFDITGLTTCLALRIAEENRISQIEHSLCWNLIYSLFYFCTKRHWNRICLTRGWHIQIQKRRNNLRWIILKWFDSEDALRGFNLCWLSIKCLNVVGGTRFQ